MAQTLTANRLIDGLVLYWQGDGWTESFAQADQFDSETAADAALAAAKEFVAKNAVVAPYLFEVKDGRPVKEREIIRALGPSVRTDLGKQADVSGFAHRATPDERDKDPFTKANLDVSL